MPSSQEGSLKLEFGAQAVVIAWNADGLLSQIELDPTQPVENSSWIPATVFRLLEDLKEYFDKGAPISRVNWDELAMDRWTEFQKRVYAATLTIPHGETRTYGWVANKIGAPLASRAVGQALSRNPVPLLVPCHRVVSNQSIGGFMGEDHPTAPQLGLKQRLIDLENRFVNPCFAFVCGA